MEWFEALILGIVQGLTEYLPVSSSGHLQIGEAVMDLDTAKYDSLTFGIVVHAATALSSILVFRKDLVEMTRGILKFTWNEDMQYAAKLCFSAIPVVAVGLFLEDYIEDLFGANVFFVGWMLLITAGLLVFTFWVRKNERKIGWADALIIGIAQAVAVLPGVSRSGSTIATALLMGIDKTRAARFSFLMLLIPILGKATLDTKDYFFPDANEQVVTMDAMPLVIGFIAALITGLVACQAMLAIVRKGKIWYFGIYCVVVGLIAIAAGSGFFG